MRLVKLTKLMFLPMLMAFFLVAGIQQTASAKEFVKFLNQLDAELIEPVDVAVSPSGDIHILDRESAKVLVFSPEGKLQYTFAEQGDTQGKLLRPEALSISQDGNVVIADTANSRVQMFDLKGKFLFELGNFGPLDGQYKRPDSVAIDNYGYIYVGDSVKKTITKYSPRGVYLRTKDLSERPTDIEFDRQQNMYVMMADAGKIVKYSPEGKILRHLPIVQLRDPVEAKMVSMSVDMRGDIYTINHSDHRIQKLDQQDNILFTFGSRGVGKGQFEKPASIAADDQGRIYIADAKNKRVQILEISGSAKAELEEIAKKPPVIDFDRSILALQTITDLNILPEKGLYALSDDLAEILYKNESSLVLEKINKEDDLLQSPKAMYVMEEGKMLVADTGNHRLQFLKPDGTSEYHFGKKGIKNSEFHGLAGVAVNSKGFIYVADTKNNRIQMFNSDGIYLNSFGKKTNLSLEEGMGYGSFLHPTSLAFDSKDQLHVLDSKNKRIQIFDDQGTFKKSLGDGDSMLSFKNPVDIAIDEADHLYVADRGRHSVLIIDPEGNLMMEYGSSGKGPSYFPHLSSIAASDGKVYVADYLVDKIKVFDFHSDLVEKKKIEKKAEAKLEEAPEEMVAIPDQTNETERGNQPEAKAADDKGALGADEITYKAYLKGKYLIIDTFSAMRTDQDSQEKNYLLTRKDVMKFARKKLSEKFGISPEALISYIIIEKEEIQSDGILKLTLRIHNQILMNKSAPLLSKTK